ncbi:MAG: FAD-binding protein [Nakamurella sp.]
MTTSKTTDQVLDSLRAAITGPVLTPDQSGYRAAVAGFDLAQQHSAPIAVSATSVDDVVATVGIARNAGLPITVIGGGHGDIPTVTAGILLTTRRINTVDIDRAARTARVGVGATWHDVMALTTPEGLAPLCGSAPAVGVGGYLLGGGLGPIGRTFGFSCDHVVSFEIVCADGALRTVTAETEPDLYWALRGGKGGFGVLTAATMQLLDLPSIYGGGEYYTAAEIPALLRAYQQFVAADVPESLSTSLAILRLPDLPVLPPPLRGQTVAQLRVGYVGSGAGVAAEVERLLVPLRSAVAAPLLGALGELPYADIGTIHNDPTVPSSHATAGILLREFQPATAEAILDVAGPAVSTPLAIVEIRHFGGAISRSVLPADAVSGRDAGFGVWVSGSPLPAAFDEKTMAATAGAVRGVLDAVTPWSTGGVQINFCGSENTAAEAANAWPADVASRLASIRRRYDPNGLFPFVPGSRSS